MASSTPRPLYPRERDPVPIVQEAEWAPGPVWTAAENLAPTGIRSPDRPARSESLYLLSYPGALIIGCNLLIFIPIINHRLGLSIFSSQLDHKNILITVCIYSIVYVLCTPPAKFGGINSGRSSKTLVRVYQLNFQ
jgi:hypothetical protein